MKNISRKLLRAALFFRTLSTERSSAAPLGSDDPFAEPSMASGPTQTISSENKSVLSPRGDS